MSGAIKHDRAVVGAAILDRIAAGETLTKILTEDGMPHINTVRAWTAADQAFRDQFQEARVMQTQVWADEIIDIADAPIVIPPEITDVKSQRAFVHREIAARQQQIAARQWLMSKVNRAAFGDRQTIDVNHGLQDVDDAELAGRLEAAAEAVGLIDAPEVSALIAALRK